MMSGERMSIYVYSFLYLFSLCASPAISQRHGSCFGQYIPPKGKFPTSRCRHPIGGNPAIKGIFIRNQFTCCRRWSANGWGHGSQCMPCSGIRGVLKPWGNWSECSKTCGWGEQTRYRECTKNVCLGLRGKFLKETRRCMWKACCPVHGQWSDWTRWSNCSASCGDGLQYRTRSCSQPVCGGKPCQSFPRQMQRCRLGDCAHWSSWSPNSKCSVTCGEGVIRRTRECYSEMGDSCVGESVSYFPCDAGTCKVNGGWCSWGGWSSCTTSCKEKPGTRKRARSCTCPAPRDGGSDCGGADGEAESCSSEALCPIDGKWGSWMTWGECSAVACTMVPGTQERKRLCDSPPPKNGGSCRGDVTESRECLNMDACEKDKDEVGNLDREEVPALPTESGTDTIQETLESMSSSQEDLIAPHSMPETDQSVYSEATYSDSVENAYGDDYTDDYYEDGEDELYDDYSGDYEDYQENHDSTVGNSPEFDYDRVLDAEDDNDDSMAVGHIDADFLNQLGVRKEVFSDGSFPFTDNDSQDLNGHSERENENWAEPLPSDNKQKLNNRGEVTGSSEQIDSEDGGNSALSSPFTLDLSKLGVVEDNPIKDVKYGNSDTVLSNDDGESGDEAMESEYGPEEEEIYGCKELRHAAKVEGDSNASGCCEVLAMSVNYTDQARLMECLFLHYKYTIALDELIAERATPRRRCLYTDDARLLRTICCSSRNCDRWPYPKFSYQCRTCRKQGFCPSCHNLILSG